MADLFQTQITIGGEVKREILPQLSKAIHAEIMQINWGDRCFESAAEIKAVLNKGVCCFKVDEQRWGEFPKLEAFLVENNIAFDRHHSARYPYQGEVVKFRPGMEGAIRGTASDNGTQTVNAQSLTNLLEQIRNKSIESKGDFELVLEHVIITLKNLCDAERVPGLEDFKIIE